MNFLSKLFGKKQPVTPSSDQPSRGAEHPTPATKTAKLIEIKRSYGWEDSAPLLVETNPNLEQIFNDPNPPIPQRITDRNRASWERADLNYKRTALALAYLQHPDPEFRKATLGFIGNIGAARVDQVLIDLLGDENTTVRAAVARTIWEREKQVNCKYAVRSLKDEMEYPGQVLGRAKAKQALDLLVQIAPDANARDGIKAWIESNG